MRKTPETRPESDGFATFRGESPAATVSRSVHADRHEGRAAMKKTESSDAAGARRELASRESDGVHVLLFWHPRDDALTVAVEDLRAGHCFEVVVDRRRALDVFYHPFAYAA
jgi:hypothetical protein